MFHNSQRKFSNRKIGQTGIALLMAVSLCACSSSNQSSDATVNDTLAISQKDASDFEEQAVTGSTAAASSETAVSEDSASSAASKASDEYVMPAYVMNAMLMSFMPTYQEVDLKDKKTDQIDKTISQIDFSLTPIGFSSIDTETGMQNNGLVTVSTKEITPLADDIPKKYEEAFLAFNASAKEARDRYENVLSTMQSRRNKQEYFRYSETLDLLPCRVDSALLGVIGSRKLTTDGAGRNQMNAVQGRSFYSVNIDGKTGNILKMTDVVQNTDELVLLAAELLYQTYVTNVHYEGAKELFTEKELQVSISKLFADGNKTEDSFDDKTQTADVLEKAALFAWSPSYLGLRLIFSASALSNETALEDYRANVSGSTELDSFDIIIPYRYAPNLFHASYTALPEEFMAWLQPGAAYAFDFDGELVPFRLSLPMEEDSLKKASFSGNYSVSMDRLVMEIPTVNANNTATTGASFYLVRHQGRMYLYVQQMTTEQGGAKLQVFKYTNYDSTRYFELIGVSDDMLDPSGTPPLNPAHFRSKRRVNILPDPIMGRLSNLYRTVYVTDNGLPGCDDTYFDVEGDFVRTTAIDLNMEVLIDFEKQITEVKLFPAGTKLTMFRAQLIPYTQADFSTPEGDVVRLHVNGVDAIDNVDGHMVEEVFKK